MTSIPRTRRRVAAAVTGALMGVSALLAGAGAAPAQETVAPEKPHWGQYRWDGGKVKAEDRAFWLFDRTDDPMLHSIIEAVAGAWNAARVDNLAGDKEYEIPFVAVYRDDANAGKCFVNQTPGYAAASACKLPFDFKLISARSTSGPGGHLTGGAFALGEGLSFEDAFTAVCRGFGAIMGLDAKDADENSCMSKAAKTGRLLWYTNSDADAVKAIYKGHSDRPVPPTTTTTVG